MLGAKTIGNATVIAFDGGPVIATDPWFGDEHDAYFGSWRISHAIPAEEKSEIMRSEYIWFSHGHPDHMNPQSLPLFRSHKILLPDHVGGRIAQDIRGQGYNVQILRDRTWVPLSKHIRVYCISDHIQNATLLMDVNGHLLVNMNDVSNTSDFGLIRHIAATFKDSYLLRLFGYGDADMINFFDEGGQRIEPKIKKQKVGRQLSSLAEALNINHVIPFSSFHRYQRSDSWWANAYTTPISAYADGFESRNCDYIDPFAYIDCASGEVTPLDPPELEEQMLDPAQFGDDWAEPLGPQDFQAVRNYFTAIEGLHRHFGFIALRVGGKDHTVDLSGPKDKGITFEVPRKSLMDAVTYEIFDDLLIGNFMKTTLHGVESLYRPNFNYLVTKYADNGRAKTSDGLRLYLKEYQRRVGAAWFIDRFSREATHRLRNMFDREGMSYQTIRRAYYIARKVI